MKPRYDPYDRLCGSTWTGQFTFVGSCDRFDLWVSGPRLRVMWGSSWFCWTAYRLDGGTLDRVAGFHESGNPTDEELDLIEHYIFLFVPAAGLKVSKLANVGV